MPALRPLLLATLSALLSGAWCALMPHDIFGAGLMFGIMVLAPQAERSRTRLLLLLLSLLANFGVLWIAMTLFMRGFSDTAACAGAGAAMAVALGMAMSLVLGRELRLVASLGAAAAGAAAGVVFVATADAAGFEIGFLVSQLVLQVGFTAAHLGDRRRAPRAAAPG